MKVKQPPTTQEMQRWVNGIEYKMSKLLNASIEWKRLKAEKSRLEATIKNNSYNDWLAQ